MRLTVTIAAFRRTVPNPLFLLLLAAVALVTAGCAALGAFPSPAGPFSAAPATVLPGPTGGVLVTGKDRSTLLFSDDRVSLTWSGINGHALVTTNDGRQYERDTTVSYWDVSSAAASGRTSTSTQFLLTVLGIILVIGLAALVLYAAFPATDR
jgi:hypothetical protein